MPSPLADVFFGRLLSAQLNAPDAWLCSAMDSGGADLDNIRSLENKGGHHNEEERRFGGGEKRKAAIYINVFLTALCHVVSWVQTYCHVEPPCLHTKAIQY